MSLTNSEIEDELREILRKMGNLERGWFELNEQIQSMKRNQAEHEQQIGQLLDPTRPATAFCEVGKWRCPLCRQDIDMKITPDRHFCERQYLPKSKIDFLIRLLNDNGLAQASAFRPHWDTHQADASKCIHCNDRLKAVEEYRDLLRKKVEEFGL